MITDSKLFLDIAIKNVEEWKAILQAINEVVENAMFICNIDGITFRGIDPSHIALLDITFPKESFYRFDCKTSFFGVRIEDLKNIVNTALNSDTIEFQISDHNMMKIIIKGTIRIEFNIKLLERTEVNIPIPKIDYSSRAKLDPKIFQRILLEINPISDAVTINSKNNQIQFLGKGDTGNVLIDLDENSSGIQMIRTDEAISSTYDLVHMTKIMNTVGKESTEIIFEYANKNPMHMKFEMPSNTIVEYYLAPRID
jgi:proliferating cell nuclear antigen